MKFMLTPLLICGLLQVIWVSLLTDVVTAESCADHKYLDACCAVSSCSFYNCTSNNGSTAGNTTCHNETTQTDICPEELTPSSSLCEGQTTTTPTPAPASGACPENTTQADCCTVPSCLFYSCISNETNTSACSNETDQAAICPSGFTPSSNLCETTPTPESECSTMWDNKEQCCNTSDCGFYICMDQGRNSSVCDVLTTTVACSSGSLPSNQCNSSSVTTTTPSGTTPSHTGNPSTEDTSTENPTDSPSTGEQSSQRFDGASFIGGIVLCLGLVAIGFFGLKFYKSRQDANYQTL